MASSGGISGIGAIFSDIGFLEVPDFQRNYSWGEMQIDAFHEDLLYSTQNDRDHFLGSTILMSDPLAENNKTLQVIDGQQRLTTIFLYLCVIRDKVIEHGDTSIKGAGVPTIDVLGKVNNLIYSDIESGSPRFRSNSLLRSFLNQYIFPEPSSNRPPVPKQHKYFTLDLRKAYFRIQQKIDESLRLIDPSESLKFLLELIKTFEKRLQLLRITTTNYSESFDIFMTLNSRGMPLGPSDLVKSLFMKHNAQGLQGSAVADKNQEIAEIWQDLTDNIGDGDVNQFLRHYLVARHTDSVIAKSVYRTIEKMVSSENGDPKVLSSELLSDMTHKSAIYMQLLRPDLVEDPVIRESCKVLHQLIDSHRILLMTVLDDKNGFNLTQMRELSRLCEVLTIRWVLIGGNAQDLENHFQKVCNQVLVGADNFESARDLLASKVPPNSTIEAQFNVDITKTSIIRTVLFRINKLVGDSSNLIANDPAKMHVEHIAPTKITDHWKSVLFPNRNDDVTAEYSARIERWGNKTLLDKPINISIGQSSFHDKCEGKTTGKFGGYKDSPIAITRDLTRENDWNYETIKLRNRWIAESFIHIWSINDGSTKVVPFHEWKIENPNIKPSDDPVDEIY